MARRKTSDSRRDLSVTLKLSPEEYQLVSYAASRSRARSVQAWMRERLIGAARARTSQKTAERILSGTAVASLLRESLREAEGARTRTARVLMFTRRRTRKDRA